MIPLGTQYLVTLDAVPGPFQRVALAEIPGLRFRTDKHLTLPAHAGWILGSVLHEMGLTAVRVEISPRHRLKFQVPRDAGEVEQAISDSELRQGVWADRLLPFQRQGIARVIQTGSGFLWWPPGAGKTAGAIAWALAAPFDPVHPGAVLTITKAAVRRQWAREIERWSNCTPWISDPGFRRSARWQTPQDYWTACFLAGRRPWFVVGWEELAFLIYGDEAHVLQDSREDEKLQEQRLLAAEALQDEDERTRSARAFGRIHGVGPNLADRILQHFGSLRILQDYGITHSHERFRAELLRIPGVGPTLASSILAVYRLIRPDPPMRHLAGFLPLIPLASVIFDEIHLASNRRRKKFIVGEGGSGIGEGGSGKLQALSRRNRVAAAEVVSRGALRRLGLTATPIPNRVRDLWGQLDLVEPYGWGGYWAWAVRYAGAHQGDFGMLDGGATRLEELTARMGLTDAQGATYPEGTGPEWAFVSQVSVQTSHGQLPPKRREVRRLDPLLLTRGDRGAAAAMAKAPDAETRLECAVAWASTCKRPVVVEEAVEAVLAGSKVLILSGRHDDVERTWAALDDRLRKEWARKLRAADRPTEAATLKDESGGPVPGLWWTHGGDSGGEDKRDLVTRAYMAWVSKQGRVVDASSHPFADAEAAQWANTGIGALAGMGCCLVATGQYLGTGLDLHDTDLLIVSMLPLTPEQLLQWEGRTARQGQLRPVLVLYFVAEGTVDEHVATLLVGKLPAVATVTGQAELDQVADEIEGIGDPEAVLEGILDLFRSGEVVDMEDDGD